MKYKFLIFALSSLVSIFAVGCYPETQEAKETQKAKEIQTPKDAPEGFKQILPRGKIASIDAPNYVDADKAKISETAYVLGVVIEGQPIAYSLNLLNSHEVVNDTIGETNFAAVW